MNLLFSFRSYCIGLIVVSNSLLGNSPANAQQDGAGKDAAAHKRSAATWELQAKTIAAQLGLSSESSDQITRDYLATRKTRQMLLKELSKSEDDDKTQRKAKIVKIDAQQREVLKAALLRILSPEQVETALLSLGSFNARWDRYAREVENFQLNDENEAKAMALVATYMTDYAKAKSAAAKSGDRFSSVTARELKASLDSGLTELLNEEQLTKWTEATAFRPGGAAKSARGEGKREGKKGGQKST